MDEKNCKNCKFWEDDGYRPYGWQSQRDIQQDFQIGFCKGPAEDNFDIRDMRSDQIAVNCGHDSGVFMGENFGCIHFKKPT